VAVNYRPMLIACVLSGCAKEKEPTPPPPLVQIARPQSAMITDSDEVVGRFASIDFVEVRPRVSGYVDRVAFRDGQDVARGQLLYVIDPRPYRAALDRARAATQRQRATVATTQVELIRARALLAANALSQQDVQTRLVQAQQAQADLAAARADERQAALNLDFTRVRAAVAGRISDRRVNPGNLVTADQTVLTTITTLNPIRFTFEAPESLYLAYSRTATGGRDAPVEVRLQDETGYPHRGRVEFIDNQVGTVAGTIRGRAVLPNPGGRLTPGLFGQMRITGGRPYRALLVPDGAVVQDQDRKVVMLVDRAGRIEQRAVTTGPLIGGLRVVRTGLDENQRVVVGGRQKAKPGEQVRAVAVAVPRPPAGAAEPTTNYTAPEAGVAIVVGN
jgi:RND family efflux transporter MFP subunit